jgi:hypothetical protein
VEVSLRVGFEADLGGPDRAQVLEIPHESLDELGQIEAARLVAVAAQELLRQGDVGVHAFEGAKDAREVAMRAVHVESLPARRIESGLELHEHELRAAARDSDQILQLVRQFTRGFSHGIEATSALVSRLEITWIHCEGMPVR